jgi:hypothetical protein
MAFLEMHLSCVAERLKPASNLANDLIGKDPVLLT